MSSIDYERLELLVRSYIHDNLIDGFDISSIVSNAQIEDGVIEVKCSEWVMWFDVESYKQLGGAGGISSVD